MIYVARSNKGNMGDPENFSRFEFSCATYVDDALLSFEFSPNWETTCREKFDDLFVPGHPEWKNFPKTSIIFTFYCALSFMEEVDDSSCGR